MTTSTTSASPYSAPTRKGGLRRSAPLRSGGSRSSAKPRTRKCKAKSCQKLFRPLNSFQKVCTGSTRCALEHTRDEQERKDARTMAAREREERADRRKRKRALMTVRDWIKIAQPAFNAWVRERDHDQPCISCGETSPPERFGGAWDCGHFRSVGAAPELRFEPLNAHRQCKSCNGGSGRFSHKAKTVSAEYRERLIVRIGLAAVEWLEGPHDPKHYTIEALQSIAKEYRARTRELRKARGAR